MIRTGLFGQLPVPWAVAAAASKPASKSVNRPANGRLNDTCTSLMAPLHRFPRHTVDHVARSCSPDIRIMAGAGPKA